MALGNRIENRVEHCVESVKALVRFCRTDEDIVLLDACLKSVEASLERVRFLTNAEPLGTATNQSKTPPTP